MRMSRAMIILMLLLVCIVVNGCSELSVNNSVQESSKSPTNLASKGFIRHWLVLGPFPNQGSEKSIAGNEICAGFEKDYIGSIGGESKAVLSTETIVAFKDVDGEERIAKTSLIESGLNNIVNLEGCFKADQKVAYAFCYIQSDKSQKVPCHFGSDDGAKVRVNGKLVHEIHALRGCKPGEDRFEIELNKGFNKVLVKVCEHTGGWGFAFEVFDEQRLALLKVEEDKRKTIQAFQDCELQLEGRSPYIFEQGSFPKIQWKNPFIVETFVGKFPLQVCWFDNELNEVTVAKKPGRYMALIEGTSPKGIKVRRAMTLYCRGKDFRPGNYYENKTCLDYIQSGAIDKQAWEDHSDFIAFRLGGLFIEQMENDPKGAIMAAYLAEMKPTNLKLLKTDTPEILHDDYHLALKLKVLGVKNKFPKLRIPKRIKGKPASALRVGTPEDAGVKEDTAGKIRSVCKEWYKASEEPFAILVARRGVIIIHEAFGETPAGPVTIDNPKYIASITKTMTGLMFAQFVDQGLINIDDPVGKYLPDFPIEGDKVVTLRHCFTHTTGLEGHYKWDGMHNPWLDNVIANGLSSLKPGKIHQYNGMGYDLAGKVMEVVSGKSIFRLMYENFLDPLGVNNTTIDDLACATTSSVEDVARVGQLILNKGSYGDLQFFSEETYNKLLPRKLNEFYPGIFVEWGIGLTWMRQAHPMAGKDGMPQGATILSKNVVGHGAASSAILRVDLDNDIVVAQTRSIAGKDYNKYLVKFLTAIDNGLRE
jgi:CubicO group peptidase (beta-lactamase class C family)